jgi:nucleotide-binding universal stress UspA family protein
MAAAARPAVRRADVSELKTVLLATDGSEPAGVAVDLAASIKWPSETCLEILEVLAPAFQAAELPVESTKILEGEERQRIDADLARARARLAHPAPMTATVMRRGRAATEIVDEAKRIAADLIIAGSRGRGPIATTLLGSVAAEVVDQAPCPVLIARTSRMRRFLVADDGSASASLALRAASRWPIFKGLPARVVSVAPVHAYTGIGPTKHEGATRAYAEHVDTLRADYQATAAAGAEELRQAGFIVESELRCGDPAHEIVRAAFESESDVIVMGSRGQSGLERLLIGSVARNVLTHAPMSVLIVHRLPGS